MRKTDRSALCPSAPVLVIHRDGCRAVSFLPLGVLSYCDYAGVFTTMTKCVYQQHIPSPIGNPWRFLHNGKSSFVFTNVPQVRVVFVFVFMSGCSTRSPSYRGLFPRLTWWCCWCGAARSPNKSPRDLENCGSNNSSASYLGI